MEADYKYYCPNCNVLVYSRNEVYVKIDSAIQACSHCNQEYYDVTRVEPIFADRQMLYNYVAKTYKLKVFLCCVLAIWIVCNVLLFSNGFIARMCMSLALVIIGLVYQLIFDKLRN